MLDYAAMTQSRIEFYRKDIDDPFTVNGFRGTWKFSNHDRIPDVLHEFLQRHFGYLRITRIPLDKINSLMNEVWEGPGSLEKIFNLTEQMRLDGRQVRITPADYVKNKSYEDDDDDVDDVELDLSLSFDDNDDDER